MFQKIEIEVVGFGVVRTVLSVFTSLIIEISWKLNEVEFSQRATAQYIGWQSVVWNYNRRDADNFIFNVNEWLCLFMDTRNDITLAMKIKFYYAESNFEFHW